MGEEATVAVAVRGVTVKPMRDRRRKRVEARVFDESGPLVAVWFNQPWIARQLGEGAQVLLHGKLRRRGELWVTRVRAARRGEAPVHTVGLVPVHPATEGISAAKLRELMWEAYPRMLAAVEPLPTALRVAERLPDRPAALAAVHFPDSEEDERGARRRLAFEELFLLQLAVAGRRRARREGRRARPLAPRGVVVDRWRWSLPFELTGDQVEAMGEIDADLDGERPMQRLLMGEVGSGKTVVALEAMLRAVENGAQAALMAPTETLAEQHHRTLDSLLGGALPVELLTGSTTAARRRDLLARLASGQLALVVGTHALIEPPVEFRDLAVVVVDEQHRFGVRQRAALDAKAPEGLVPHALHMTATPIPRTLSLTAYGDLDATVLRELPAGPPAGRDVRGRRRARPRTSLRAHPRGDPSGAPVLRRLPAGRGVRGAPGQGRHGRVRAPAHDRVRRPARRADPRPAALEAEGGGDGGVRARRGGRARGDQRDRGRHRRAERDRDADRGGRALRALAAASAARARRARRARVGLHPVRRPQAARLEAIAGERDGFRLAEIDLELRGAGDVLGTRQHGLPEFRVARLPEDAELLVRARDRADAILLEDPRLEAPEHALLRDAVVARFGSELDPIPA